MSWKSSAVGGFALLAAAFLLGGAPAQGLSLADLAAGGSLTSGNGVVYENFSVQIKGKLTRDLASYEVEATGQGFQVTGDSVAAGRGRRAGRGSIQIRYDASTDHPDGLQAGAFGILPGMTTVSQLSVKSTLFDGKQKLGKLDARLGGGFDELALGGLAGVHVKERIKLSGGFGGSAVGGGFTAVPEPSTLLLVAAGLAAGAALRRTRV